MGASSSGSIIREKLYIDYTESIPQQASKVTVTEHAYFYDDTEDSAELFNNSTGYTVSNYVVKFSQAPVYVNSITVEGDGLTVSELHPNYAVVTGRGILKGVPYTHTTYDVTRVNSSVVKEYEISLTDDTLISIANSEMIADRLMEYYSSKNTISTNIVYTNEVCGRRYNFINRYGEAVLGYLSKLKKSVSSFTKADCEFVTDYAGTQYGNNFENVAVLTNTSPSTFTVPDGVTRMRVIIIGAGSGGDSGRAGKTGSTSGGSGGKGGNGGAAGRIYEYTIENPASSYGYRCGAFGTGGPVCTLTNDDWDDDNPPSTYVGTEGGASYFGDHNSDEGGLSEHGFVDVFNDAVYARPGRDGVDGGDGGSSGDSTDGEEEVDKRLGKSGDDVTYNGVTYTGGTGGNGLFMKIPEMTINVGGTIIDLAHNEIEYQYRAGIGGGGGGGAAVGVGRDDDASMDGGDAWSSIVNSCVLYDDAEHTFHLQESEAWRVQEWHENAGGPGGNGATPVAVAIPALAGGNGGNGGHGGGGGGGTGSSKTGSETIAWYKCDFIKPFRRIDLTNVPIFERTTTATSLHRINERFILQGTPVVALETISVGTTITIGSNVRSDGSPKQGEYSRIYISGVSGYEDGWYYYWYDADEQTNPSYGTPNPHWQYASLSDKEGYRANVNDTSYTDAALYGCDGHVWTACTTLFPTAPVSLGDKVESEEVKESSGGVGGAGTRGSNGCIIVYY